MNRITLSLAETVCQASLEKGRKLGLKPLSVAVVDAGGHLIAFRREDGASNLRPQIAIGKAAGALALGVSSRKIGEMAAERPAFVGALGEISAQGVIPAAGGVIAIDDAGSPLGAVGVTGDSSDNDEICALAGLEAAGLKVQA